MFSKTSMFLGPHQKKWWGWYRHTYLSPPVIFLLAVPRRCFFCRSFLSFVFRVCLCHTVLSVPCSHVVTCWERTDLLYLLCVMFYLCFSHFPLRCPGSGVILDCIDSWSLSTSLLSKYVQYSELLKRFFFKLPHTLINMIPMHSHLLCPYGK